MPGKTEDGRPKADNMTCRSASIRTDVPSSIDESTRSIEVVLATENPVLIFDWDRGPIKEILLMKGAELPPSGQLVMLDSHSRYETADIIGSVRDIRIEGGSMIGRAYFSSAPEAEGPWLKTKEGHLTDFSVGYRFDKNNTVWVADGQRTVVEGKTYAGPVRITTKWIPRELSAVPIGADENAKARSEHTQISNKEEHTMDEKLRKYLERMGLPVTATEAEAIAFMDKAEGERREPEVKKIEPDLEKIRAEALGEERTRISEIDALVTQYEVPEMARELIVGGKTLAEASRAVLDKVHEKAKNPGFSGIRIGAEEKDKFRAAANDALILRAGYTIEKPVQGANDLRGLTLVELARESLRMSGQSHRGNSKEMVGRALTSSDFPNILANLATKSLQIGWDSATETWQTWCGVGSVSDFKTYYDNALSEFDDLEEVKDAGEIPIGSFSEKTPETYKAVTYAKKFKVTRVMIINDDMGALTEMPAKRAEAAARKVGDVAYAVLTSNGNMGDGVALFHAVSHLNDAISGFTAVPGVSNIAEGIRAMGTQKDIRGLRRLNIAPKFFIAPKALEGSSEVFFKSGNFADTNTIATDSSLAATRANPYSGAYFTRVYEPRLDDDNDAQWYLAGPKGKTVKVVFLNGVQAPLMEVRQPGFTIEGFEYAVSIDAGAYATDYRGLYRNAGE